MLPTGNRWNHALFTWPNKNKISVASQTVATARIMPKICKGQPPTICSQCSKFHPNRFTFGGVIAERVNTIFCSVEYFHYRLFWPIRSLQSCTVTSTLVPPPSELEKTRCCAWFWPIGITWKRDVIHKTGST